MKEVKGFKAFNIDSTNRYGKSFAEGETYRVIGDIKFGLDGNGFHMCTALSDVFRFVNAKEEDVLVAAVTWRGKFVKRDDNYYGYYDMYSFEEITIDRFLSRSEIIARMLSSNNLEIKKFIMTFKLNDDEKMMFAMKFRNDIEMMKYLLYYQFDCKDIYEKNRSDFECKKLRMVLKDGQNNC